jgi:2-(1,2-epoxy-1,2-dihydrophenyl)acetyl-CoA isomerase
MTTDLDSNANDSSVLLRLERNVARITLNRPQRLNALDRAMRLLLLSHIRNASADPDVHVIVLAGAGRAFCVGQDLGSLSELNNAYETVARTYNPLITAIMEAPKPVIAAVNGPAAGAGMGLALACDVVIMSDNAYYSCAFGKVGLVPDSGTTAFLVKSLGRHLAFEIATTGRRIAAAEALKFGIATSVVAEEAFDEHVEATLARLCCEPSGTLALTKELIRTAVDASSEEMLRMEAVCQGLAASAETHTERRTAFLTKTK